MGSVHVSWHAPLKQRSVGAKVLHQTNGLWEVQNWKLNYWSSQHWSLEVGHQVKPVTSSGPLEVSMQASSKRFLWSCKTWQLKLPLQILGRSGVLLQVWRAQICAHEVGSEQHQNKKVDFKSSCKNWSWYFNLGQKKWNMNRHPSPMHNKRSEVLLHHLPTFKSQTCSQVLLLRKNLQQVPISFPHIGK